MSTSKQTNHLTINLLENDDILTYLVEHNMTNEGELYLVEGESDYAQSDWGVTDSADPAYILNKPDLSVYLTSDDISGKVDKAGDTMTGKLSVPQVETGTASDSYFQSRFFRGEGNTSTYYHAIDFGYANHNQVDFHEYGAVWNFYRNTSGTASGGTLVGKITSNGWEAGAKLTGAPTAPTPAKGTNTTQIATTEYVQTELLGKLDSDGDGSYVTSTFTSASTRENIATGETLQVSLGKISKWLSDLSSVAFTGDYSDLSNIPIISNDLTNDLKASYDAAYVHALSEHAPVDAEKNVQSDWNVADSTSDAFILNKPSSLPANGGNADTVDDKHASDFALATDITDMATQTWVGQQGYVTASEGEIVDPVPEYATTEYIASLDHVTRTEMLTEIERQIQGAINASY